MWRGLRLLHYPPCRGSHGIVTAETFRQAYDPIPLSTVLTLSNWPFIGIALARRSTDIRWGHTVDRKFGIVVSVTSIILLVPWANE